MCDLEFGLKARSSKIIYFSFFFDIQGDFKQNAPPLNFKPGAIGASNLEGGMAFAKF